MNIYMKTKKALAGLLGLLGSLAAFLPLPTLVGFLFTASLQDITKQIKKKKSNKKKNRK